MIDENGLGLSSGNKTFFVVLTAFGLAVAGPIEPYGLIVRVVYLVLIPFIVWLALTYFSNRIGVSSAANDRLTRTLAGAVAGSLIVGAYLSYTSDYHSVCTARELTHDGSECVGEYVIVKGGARWQAFMLLMIAVFAAWIGIFANAEEG